MRRPRWQRLLRLGRARRDVDEELAFHFESVVEELMARGRPRAVAEAEARRRFGNEMRYRRELERIDRGVRAMRRRRAWAGGLWQSAGLAVRAIRRSPGLSLGIVLAFGLGIGANTTMFGIVDRLLLSPPSGIADPGRVHRLLVSRQFIGRQVRTNTLGLKDYEDFREVGAFEGVAAYSSLNRRVLGRGPSARPVVDVMVTGSYWSVLGVKPAVGRFFTAVEDRAGGERLAVLGWSLYQKLYDGERDAIGRTIDFGFGDYTIVGVAPRGFTGVDLTGIDLWIPLQVGGRDVMGERWLTGGRGYNWLRVVARLAPGATVASAEAVATPVHRRGRSNEIARGSYDANAAVVLTPLIAARSADGPKEAKVAAWLAGVSAIVLLIACVNVANLLLARSIRRRRELAIQLALGVSRARLIGLTAAEALGLSLLGGVAALLIAHWGGDALRVALLPNVWFEAHGLNATTLAFTLVLSILTGLVAALIPALHATRHDVADVLRSTGGGITRSTNRVRSMLSVSQAALSVVLLVGAGLFVRSLASIRSLDPGFDLDRLLAVSPVRAGSGMSADDMRRFHGEAVARLARLPSVTAVASSIGVPFLTSWTTALRVPGVDSIPARPSGGPYIVGVSPSYMKTLGLQIRRGRDFADADLASPMVAIVNESLARLVWPAGDPVGKCLILDEDDAPCTTVVGVVENAIRGSLQEQPNPQYYVPLTHPAFEQAPEMLFVRVGRADAATIGTVREALLEMEPRLRFVNVRPLSDFTDPELRSWTLGASMFTVFGLLALVVAAIGLYSVLAFDVAQRTREIGLRSALGAGTARQVISVMGRAARLTVTGLAAGVLVALLLGTRIEGLLYHTSARDPVTIAGVSLALLVVAALAGGIPAWRAARVDPNIALRAD